MTNQNQYIRFDWAMKRLLRNKVNFGVLEGFLTTLLGERIIIQKLLESESNQEDEYDNYILKVNPDSQKPAGGMDLLPEYRGNIGHRT